MKFIVDAQLPRRLALHLREVGHDVFHTLDLPHGNRTTDTEINELSEAENRVVITKDADFVNSFVLSRRPHKLLLVSTGNITNTELEALFVAHAPSIAATLQSHSFIELNRNSLIVHR
jgi:predicted nuclease of predicted toxin-antitoxin system